MAFPDDITMTDESAVATTYSIISMVDRKSIRSDETRPNGTPATLTISHQTVGKNMEAKDRHLVRLDRVEEDTGSDDIATQSGAVYLVIEQPRRIITNAMILSMLEQLIDFVSVDGNQTKILSNQP